MADDYFDDAMVNRQRLLWAIATRRQLERWEPIVAAINRELLAERKPARADVWSAEIEHHLALVAARNLLRALALDPASSVPVDPTMRTELLDGRNLHEHWDEYLPVFNVKPPVRTPAADTSGERFAKRNPGRSPYGWFRWSNQKGAQLVPNVPAPALHELLDAVEADVLGRNPTLSDFVPERAPSPWIRDDGEWWPGADV